MQCWKGWMAGLAACAVLMTGCVTRTPPAPEIWQEASGPAWSYNALPNDLDVNVSPAGDTLRWGGSVGTVVGRGVDIAQNATYRNRIHEALEDYDSAALLEATLEQRLTEAMDGELGRVHWLHGMGRYASRREAEEAHYGQLARSGVDLLLEVQSRHGVFGPDAGVATALRANLYALPGPRRLWREVIVVAPGPAYAFADLGNPTRTSGIIPRMDLRFGVDDERVDALLADGASLLKAELDASREGAIAALLVAMGLSDDAWGHYMLGRVALGGRDFDDAIEHFETALKQDRNLFNARNGLAVAHGHLGEFDKAIALATDLLADDPGYAPAHANLAWWFATEKGDSEAARRHLDAAPREVRALLEEAIEDATET